MGSDINYKSLRSWEIGLYDSDNGAAGVVYTTGNGAWCQRGSKNMQLRVELLCPNTHRYMFKPEWSRSVIEENVVEYPTCVYTVQYFSVWACPTSCMTYYYYYSFEGTVCSGRGVCVSDPNDGSARCICDDGWEGDTCEKEESYDKKNNNNISVSINIFLFIGLIVGVFVIQIVATFLVWWWCKKHKLQSAIKNIHIPIAIQNDHAGENEANLDNVHENDMYLGETSMEGY